MEVDSQVLVQLIKSDSLASWPLCNVLCRVRRSLFLAKATIAHIFHEANSTADKLAVLDLPLDMVFHSVSELRPAAKATVLLDNMQISSIRAHNVRK